MSSLSEQDEDYKNFILDLNSPLRVARSKRYVFMLGSDVRGINLEDYTKSTPPGWQAYMHNYPLKHYRERLALWMRITDVPAEKLGPTILGRIKGSAHRLIPSQAIGAIDASYDWPLRYYGQHACFKDRTVHGIRRCVVTCI